MTFTPVPGTSVTPVRPCHNTRGTGTACFYLPGTSNSSGRQCHNTRNFCEFSKTLIPVPGTSVIYVTLPYRSRNPQTQQNTTLEHSKVVLCRVLTEPYPEYLPGYYLTNDFCMFCMTFIPVPGTYVSAVRPCHNTRGTGTVFHTCPELL